MIEGDCVPDALEDSKGGVHWKWLSVPATGAERS
jgi:hypothetical protein